MLRPSMARSAAMRLGRISNVRLFARPFASSPSPPSHDSYSKRFRQRLDYQQFVRGLPIDDKEKGKLLDSVFDNIKDDKPARFPILRHASPFPIPSVPHPAFASSDIPSLSRIALGGLIRLHDVMEMPIIIKNYLHSGNFLELNERNAQWMIDSLHDLLQQDGRVLNFYMALTMNLTDIQKYVEKKNALHAKQTPPLAPELFDMEKHLPEAVNDFLKRYNVEFIDLIIIQGCDEHPHPMEFLEQSFRGLERLVAANQCRLYGIDSNRFSLPMGDSNLLSVSALIDAAQRAVRQLREAGEVLFNKPHFSTIRFPLNIFQHEIFTVKNHPHPQRPNELITAAAFAQHYGLLLLSTNTLESRDYADQPIRLESFKSYAGTRFVQNIKESFKFLLHLEVVYTQLLEKAKADNAAAKENDPAHYQPLPPEPDPMALYWGHIFAASQDILYNISTMEKVAAQRITPLLSEALDKLKEFPNVFVEWGQRYKQLMPVFLHDYRIAVEHTQSYVNEEINAWLAAQHATLKKLPKLEQKVIVLMLSIPGHTMLFGNLTAFFGNFRTSNRPANHRLLSQLSEGTGLEPRELLMSDAQRDEYRQQKIQLTKLKAEHGNLAPKAGDVEVVPKKELDQYLEDVYYSGLGLHLYLPSLELLKEEEAIDIIVRCKNKFIVEKAKTTPPAQAPNHLGAAKKK